MPELPEVEIVRRGLDRWVAGRTVAAAEVLHPRAARRHLAGPDDVVARLLGRTVLGACRRGKYLWLPLSAPGIPGEPGGAALLGHLGMSGQLLVLPPGEPTGPHLRARLSFTDGGRELRYVDQRTFGGLSVEPLVGPPGGEVPAAIAHIARDPLDPAFDDAAFTAALRRRRTGLKRALLDQSLVSGIGNIYADEALWRARLHYARPTETLTRPGVARLLAGVRGGAGRGAGGRRHVVRLAVRRRQRRERLLRPVAGRLRPAGRAVPPVRHPDPPRPVHEPLVLHLPALPAPPAPGPLVTGAGGAAPARTSPRGSPPGCTGGCRGSASAGGCGAARWSSGWSVRRPISPTAGWRSSPRARARPARHCWPRSTDPGRPVGYGR